jgi:N,N-dimethylformamidase
MLGYADRISVAPGDSIDFMVSCDGVEQYRSDLVRLRCGDLHPQGRGLLEEVVPSEMSGEYDGREQPIHVGSYAVVDDSTSLIGLESFSLQAWIWPTAPGRGKQVVMGCWSGTRQWGYALVLDESGAIALRLGDGRTETISTEVALFEREWVWVGASFDASTGTVRVWQAPLRSHPGADTGAQVSEIATLAPATKGLSFLIAASCCDADDPLATAEIFNGKIEAAQVFSRALNFDEAEDAKSQRDWVAAWDFARDTTTDRIRDASSNGLDGRIVNLPTRAMTGHAWTGEEMDWRRAPYQYGAIHFHDDDLYDCGWQADFTLTVPEDLRSGVYAARLVSGDETEYIPFAVRPPRGHATARALFLMPSASYLAYANEHIATDGGGQLQVLSNHLQALSAQDLLLDSRPDLGYSVYDLHSDGSGVCYSSRLRPVVNFRPGVTSAWVGAAGTTPWQFNADLPLLDWLEHEGFDYDVATDEDLHAEGAALLERYPVVLTGSHPEYYSTAMHDAVHDYLETGGRLMYLGGNGFYWRIAFHETLPGVIELRRAEDGIRDWVAAPGEYHHSFSGEYGGLWQRNGRPIQALVGVGMAGQGFDVCGYYRRTPASHDPRAAFIFAGVEDEIIGDFGTAGGGAAGIEVDRCDRALGSPPHTLVVATSENLDDTYYPGPEDVDGVTPLLDALHNPDVRADITFFETAAGGAVFSVGSIAWIGSLSWNQFDNNVAAITRNVLRSFLDTKAHEPFKASS